MAGRRLLHSSYLMNFDNQKWFGMGLSGCGGFATTTRETFRETIVAVVRETVMTKGYQSQDRGFRYTGIGW